MWAISVYSFVEYPYPESYTWEMGAKLTRASIGAKKSTSKKRIPGIDTGKIWMAKDFGILTKRELAVWTRR